MLSPREEKSVCVSLFGHLCRGSLRRRGRTVLGTSALNKGMGQVELPALLERVSNCEQWEVSKDLEKGRCFW